MGRTLGRRLHGPNQSDVFRAIPRRWVLKAVSDSLAWHRLNELKSANSVLNACRSWQYTVSGEFPSKAKSAEWAMQQPNCPRIVQQAVAARKSKEDLPVAGVTELYGIVLELNRLKLEAYT